MSKWLICPTQSCSTDVKGKRYTDFGDLPWIIRLYLKFFNEKVHVILDECSWIKTNAPMPEQKKSSRSRVIKMLEAHSESRCAMTGTLMTKSPVNIVDPYSFLSASFFENESMYELAEEYCIMMSLRTMRGTRVMISQKEWDKARKRMINAYKFGGESQLEACKGRVVNELGIKLSDCEHILTHRTYTPFKNVEALMRRVESVTMTVKREDIFDIGPDKFVYAPIKRGVKLDATGKRLGEELVKVGFTDNLTLGKAASLELLLRLQDICNGFEPIEELSSNVICDENEWEDTRKPRRIVYEPLPENPKLDACMDLLEEIDTMQNQVVIWCSRRNAFDSIAERLTKENIPFVMYSGMQTSAEKKEAEEKAASGEARVFLANPAAAGFGLNCLKGFNYCAWYCVGTSVEQYHQAQHRILRGQSKVPKFAYQLFVEGSIEERIYRTLDAGQELLGAANSHDIFKFV